MEKLELNKNNITTKENFEVNMELEGELLEKVQKLYVEEEIRKILQKVQNKNALYKTLGLNTTYLNLKNFINDKEKHLKQKSVDAMLNYTGGLLIPLFIIPEELTDDQLNVLYDIQEKFVEKLDGIHEKTNDFASRKTTPKITKDDINAAQGIIDEIMSTEVQDNEDDFFGVKNDLIRADETTELTETTESKKDIKDIDNSALEDIFNDGEEIDIDVML